MLKRVQSVSPAWAEHDAWHDAAIWQRSKSLFESARQIWSRPVRVEELRSEMLAAPE